MQDLSFPRPKHYEPRVMRRISTCKCFLLFFCHIVLFMLSEHTTQRSQDHLIFSHAIYRKMRGLLHTHSRYLWKWFWDLLNWMLMCWKCASCWNQPPSPFLSRTVNVIT
jgi:hypothetical protein